MRGHATRQSDSNSQFRARMSISSMSIGTWHAAAGRGRLRLCIAMANTSSSSQWRGAPIGLAFSPRSTRLACLLSSVRLGRRVTTSARHCTCALAAARLRMGVLCSTECSCQQHDETIMHLAVTLPSKKYVHTWLNKRCSSCSLVLLSFARSSSPACRQLKLVCVSSTPPRSRHTKNGHPPVPTS